ncbi:MAG: hypothetical protein IKN64_02880 [Desulfovibrio sp.]|nr:hypothetical protein [Desulfovibrio sp.]
MVSSKSLANLKPSFRDIPPEEHLRLAKRGGITASIQRRENAILRRRKQIFEVEQAAEKAVSQAKLWLREHDRLLGEISKLRKEIEAFETAITADWAKLRFL